jgi:hypothetical protein
MQPGSIFSYCLQDIADVTPAFAMGNVTELPVLWNWFGSIAAEGGDGFQHRSKSASKRMGDRSCCG